MELIIALTLLCFGTVVAGVLATILWRSLFGDPRTLLTRISIGRKAAALDQFSKEIDRGTVGGARGALQRAIYFGVARDDAAVERISAHHFKVLEQIVTTARARSVKLEPLPVLEDLFHHRLQLLRGYLDTTRSLAALSTRGKEKGAPTPSWALQEYQRRLADITDRLTTNRTSLLQQVDALVQLLFDKNMGKGRDNEVTYH